MTTIPTGSLPSNAYRSYLVRFWQSAEQGHWRASAQCVQTGNTILFGDIDQLLAFLQSEIKHKPGASTTENPAGTNYPG